MKEFLLGKIINIASKVHSWAHKQKYNKEQKFCACASKKFEHNSKSDEKSIRLQ